MVQIEFQFLRLAIARVNRIVHGGSDRLGGAEMKPSRQGLRGCRHDMVRSGDCRRSAPLATKSEAKPPAAPSDFEDDSVAKRRDHENPVRGGRVHASSGGSVAVNGLASPSRTLFCDRDQEGLGLRRHRCVRRPGRPRQDSRALPDWAMQDAACRVAASSWTVLSPGRNSETPEVRSVVAARDGGGSRPGSGESRFRWRTVNVSIQ